MKPDLENSFCYYPFTALALKRWYKGKIYTPYPCCNTAFLKHEEWENSFPPTGKMTPEEIFHSETFNKLRRDLLDGVKPEICSVCWKNEENYQTSTRLFSHHILKHDIDLDNPKLQVLDIGTGDVCNLQCRSCNPVASNSLRKDQKAFRDRGVKYEPWDTLPYRYTDGDENKSIISPSPDSKQWNALLDNVHNYTYIKASGGETFLSSSFIKFLDHCIEQDVAKDIVLNFTTNATQFSNSMFNRLSKFRYLEPIFSIDGIDKVYEYVRYPQSFDGLEKNVKRYLSSKLNNEFIVVNYVLQAYNIHNIKDTVEWIHQLCVEHNVRINFTIELLKLVPLNVSCLPTEMLIEQYDILKSIPEQYNDTLYFNIDAALAHLKKCIDNGQDMEMLEKFIKTTKEFDINRNQSYKDYCHSDLVAFIDKYYHTI